MSDRQWIMSEGGALICMERRFQESWGGCDFLSVAAAAVPNDYERTARVFDYLETLPLSDGQALIFGEGPLDTAVWRSNLGQVLLVRIFFCDDDFDLDQAMVRVDASVFDDPAEALEVSFSTTDLVLFDSAEAGREPEKQCLSFALTPGRYRILTQCHNPDATTSLILHRFDLIDDLAA